jgi:hypothetical protein
VNIRIHQFAEKDWRGAARKQAVDFSCARLLTRAVLCQHSPILKKIGTVPRA